MNENEALVCLSKISEVLERVETKKEKAQKAIRIINELTDCAIKNKICFFE